MTLLFDPLPLRGVTLRHRVGVSPMCQYSSEDGFASDWHLVHLGSRAVGGAAVVFTEAAAVEARGRISPNDLGLWKEEHGEMLARIAHFVESQGAVAGIQLAHAGRKASVSRPWEGDRPLDLAAGGWVAVAPSAVPFREGGPVPHALTVAEIAEVQAAFVAAARRALAAGFRFVEIHAAHGYLAHEFYSPLCNRRDDAYGGTFDNRIRFLLETVAAVRHVWPDTLPLSVRLSCTDWMEGGWTPEDTVSLARRLAAEGVDIVDCSSGGAVPHARVPTGPGYQVPFAEAVRREAGVPSAAVGMITTAAQAAAIVEEGRADLVLLARQMLRDPYFALHAAGELGEKERVRGPVQYGRAF